MKPSDGGLGSRVRTPVALLLALCLAVAACGGAPIGLKHVHPEVAYRELTADALSSGRPSNATQIVLRRHDLKDRFDDDPQGAIAELHGKFVTGEAGPNELFALAELSFLHAQRLLDSAPSRTTQTVEVSKGGRRRIRARSHFLASALYSYAFLFPGPEQDEVALIDPKARTAFDLYNGALASALSLDDGKVHPRAGTYGLPFGSLEVAFDARDLEWADRQMTDFLPVSEYEVHGLNNRYRQSGIGAPLAARTEAKGGANGVDEFVSPYARVPATAVLRIEEPRRQLSQSELRGVLRVYAATNHDSVEIDGITLPLETERSAALAATLEASRYWQLELAAFLGKAFAPQQQTTLLRATAPHRPGRIPVVFVHGTYSSPPTWANMVNDLIAVPWIRDRYEFWFFRYDSGNPIAYSSMLLRRSLTEAVERFDPDGTDPCLRHMVVIGHSQGGLLTKMTAIDSGNRFWENVSSKPFDEARLRRKTRQVLAEALFVEPLPFVDRVVFIATPHRGSYLAGPQLVRRLAARLIRLPGDLVRVGADVATLGQLGPSGFSIERIPTSIDNMSPDHPFIRAISAIPVAPEVTANSIIAVKDDGPIESGTDGVVKYSSAHIDGVESERVVRSAHSCLANPNAVAEVSRILKLHAEETTCPGGQSP